MWNRAGGGRSAKLSRNYRIAVGILRGFVQGDLPAAKYAIGYDRQTGYAENSADGGTLLAAFGAAKWGGVTIGVGYEKFSGESRSRRA
ncbi:MAG: hypothetical protein O7D96_07255, partial [SAR324 cluster bacterium]|nr:hypothetical protein [SAR324 cluster bacterium]